MEIAFSRNTLDCLQRAVWEVKQTEQTQELKIPEAMPDIGTVLGAWGQRVIRGKTWHGNGMTVNGGIMVWVLYAPEDGTMPRTVESWIPWQLHWDFPQTQRDGTMLVHTALQELDARSVSARKLMLRAVVSAAGEALEPVKLEYSMPMDVPESVQIRKESYPLAVLREAGEKAFTLEEELKLPPGCADARKLMYCSLLPEITDSKIMADKIVFRGNVHVHGLCRCEGDVLQPFSLQLPFSQYGELERSYADSAEAWLSPEVSDLEPDLTENGTLLLKAGVVGQYAVCDRPVVEIVTDAYCPTRVVDPQWEQLEVPVILERRTDPILAEQTVEAEGEAVLDAAFCMGHPVQSYGGEDPQLRQTGNFRVLYVSDGGLRTADAAWEGQLQLPSAAETRLLSTVAMPMLPQTEQLPGQIHIQTQLQCHTVAVTDQQIPMITGLELGDPIPSDPGRPSLILRRVGKDSLWQIAKQSGSTVDAIRQANNLEREPEPDSILLIPIA